MVSSYPTQRHSGRNSASFVGNPATFTPGYTIPTSGVPAIPADEVGAALADGLKAAAQSLRGMSYSDFRMKAIGTLAGYALDYAVDRWVKTPAVQGSAAGYDFTGWSKIADFGRAPSFDVVNPAQTQPFVKPWPNFTKRYNVNYSGALAGFSGQVPEFFIAPTADEFSLWFYNQVSSGYWRVSSSQSWARTTSTETLPVFRAAVPARAAHIAIPVEWFPADEWADVPYKPHYNPLGDPLRGPVTVTAIGYKPGLHPVPKPGTPPPTRPPKVDTQYPEPPGKGVKEKKVSGKFGAAISFGFKAIETASEVKDFINALWKGMPDWVRKLSPGDGYKELPNKVALMYKYWQYVDGAKALENVLANDQEDRAVGKFQGALSDARQHLGIVTGPSFHGVR